MLWCRNGTTHLSFQILASMRMPTYGEMIYDTFPALVSTSVIWCPYYKTFFSALTMGELISYIGTAHFYVIQT
jgi:hypothetical protein